MLRKDPWVNYFDYEPDLGYMVIANDDDEQ